MVPDTDKDDGAPLPYGTVSANLTAVLPIIPYTATGDDQYTITEISPLVETKFGAASHEWVADSTAYFCHIFASDRDRVRVARQLCLAAGGSFSIEYRIRMPDNRLVWMQEMGALIPGDGQHPRSIQGILFDVSERRRDVERELYDWQIHELNRLKGEFISLVSHELRTPLTPIRGTIDLLQAGHLGMLNREQKQMLDIAYRQTLRLQSLINALLDLAALENQHLSLYRRTISMTDLLQESCKALLPSFNEKGLELSCSIEGVLPLIIGDYARIGQVIKHVLGNGLKFTQQGGVTVAAVAGDGIVRTIITDTGIGLASNELERVFDRFTQVGPHLTRTQRGLGIGLAIDRHMIAAHGGKIWAESPGIGKGITIVIELPAISLDGAQNVPDDCQQLCSAGC